MDRALDGIDHVIIAVKDLEAAPRDFARLGFNTTPRGRHVGKGTANHCIMLESDYLEILGIVDPNAWVNRLDERLERRGEGLMAMVVRSRDAQVTHAAWTKAGLEPDEPRALGRLLEVEGGVEMAFSNVYLDPAHTAGLQMFACHHLTPELLRRKAWLDHPNGATGIASLTIVAADTGPVVAALGKLFGSASVTETDHVHAVQTGSAVILVAPPEDAALIHHEVPLPHEAEEPVIAVLTLKVDDTDASARFLDLQAVPHLRRRDGSIVIGPEQARGVAIELIRG